MVEFGSSGRGIRVSESEEEGVEQGIEQHVREADVMDNALRVVAKRHEEQHKEGEHHVTIKGEGDRFNEKEEEAIEQIKKEVDKDIAGEYRRATAESAMRSEGLYKRGGEAGGGGGEGSGDYKQHGHREEASCSCGWRATPQDAMKEFFRAGKVETGVKYETSGGKPGVGYHKEDKLEDITEGYQSPIESGQFVYQS